MVQSMMPRQVSGKVCVKTGSRRRFCQRVSALRSRPLQNLNPQGRKRVYAKRVSTNVSLHGQTGLSLGVPTAPPQFYYT